MISQAHQTYYHRQRHKYQNTVPDPLPPATQLSLPIRSNGYVKVEDILQLTIRMHTKIPVEEVLWVVERNPNQCYSTIIKGGELFIRANQGYSMKVVASDIVLTEITSVDQVPVCVHSTFWCFLLSIMRTGLNWTCWNHVHFAIGLPKEEGVISGMMDSVEVLIYLNVAKVLLTEGFAGVMPCEYFEKAKVVN
ncbi:hypothetical protein SELMODRAFT_403616 [Selaginella moellendorffii]|uniref:2'-phosphotransferase n=1 Tax=Selaginella moellendorffii TaxID=88036 RepID=D8QRZ6_SELML|nr:hypothetical protein SELMODRAFT_403616 [Selaginella moellendorffii]